MNRSGGRLDTTTKPQWPLKDYTDYSGPDNTLLAGLNLIQELKLASELVGPLQTLFEAAEGLGSLATLLFQQGNSLGHTHSRDAERYNSGYTELYLRPSTQPERCLARTKTNSSKADPMKSGEKMPGATPAFTLAIRWPYISQISCP
ncbi:MAG: hypothetical protein R3C56_03965 [Pirellulaceae bacterium]